MNSVTVKKGELLVVEVEQQSFEGPHHDWEETNVCIPAMGFLIDDGVLFIRGAENTWIWMCNENVERIVGDDDLPDLRDRLNAKWQQAMGN